MQVQWRKVISGRELVLRLIEAVPHLSHTLAPLSLTLRRIHDDDLRKLEY